MAAPRSEDRPAAVRPQLDIAGLDRLVGFQIRRTFLWINQLFAEIMEARRLAPGQFGALKVIAANPGCMPSALAPAIGLDPSTLTPILNQLEGRGLIERRTGADKRRTQLHATEAAVKTIAEAEADVLRHEAMITSALTEAERRQLIELLGKVLSARPAGSPRPE
jgi:DNA-binding MarR family transcriptional regulator